jgi:hypothetical protein
MTVGLDMSFHREVHTYTSLHDNDTIAETIDGKLIPTGNLGGLKSRTVDDLVGYLRKVNSVHAWIVDNLAGGVDECQRIDLDSDSLAQLHDAIETALETGEGMEPRAGFFFGNTDKDEYWQEDLRDALHIVEWILKDMTPAAGDPNNWRNSKSYYYQASW